MTQEIPALPVGTAGPDVYANVAKTANTEIAMSMESVRAGVTIHIMGNDVILPVLRRIVKDVIKCMATVHCALEDCME